MDTSLQNLYRSFFHHNADRKLCYVRSPGRVNFLGAHTDYSGGLVLPAAIDLSIDMLGQIRDDRKVVVHSTSLNETVEFSVDRYARSAPHSWVDYVKGVVHELMAGVGDIPGFQIAISSNLPVAAGLSSSAALEVGIAVFILQSIGKKMEPIEIARVCKNAENNYVGMQCGIMDQMASTLGKKDAALFIDCGTMEYSYIPFASGKAVILIIDTGVRRSLLESRFNEKRDLVIGALNTIRSYESSVAKSSDISMEMFLEYSSTLSADARPLMEHVVRENLRVAAGADALKKEDFSRFGSLMTESYNSSKELFGVTISELDYIAEIAADLDGAFGVKLMGGGYGGAVAVLVEPDAAPECSETISRAYKKKFGREPSVYTCTPSDAVSVEIIG
ncbi:galactokinase [candidate division KSB1 bacterium]